MDESPGPGENWGAPLLRFLGAENSWLSERTAHRRLV
jgi:hypothetical protein